MHNGIKGRVLIWAAVIGATWALALEAGDGIVKLQTGEPACPDSSGDIYVDCGNGTVTDNRTGLVWLKSAACFAQTDPVTARAAVAGLSDLPGVAQDCGLEDGSSPGEWRLAALDEWEQMVADAVALGCVDTGLGGPSITTDDGLSCWQEGPNSSFTGVQSAPYWSSRLPSGPTTLNLATGVPTGVSAVDPWWTWPVRGGG